MTEPSENGTPQAPPAAPVPAESEAVSGFDKLLAAACIMIGIGVIILGLDSLSGGRVLGLVGQEE